MSNVFELARRFAVPALLMVFGAAIAIGATFVVNSVDQGGTEFVVVNDDLTITVTNRSQLPFGLAFEIPTTCLGVREEISASVPGASAADDFIRTRAVSKISLLTALGEEICSYSDWMSIQVDVLNPLAQGET